MEVPSGQVRRNRTHLRVRASQSEAVTTDRDSRVIQTRSRTGTQIQPPARYTE